MGIKELVLCLVCLPVVVPGGAMGLLAVCECGIS